MAWSGSFASGYGVPGNSYSPWLQMEWKVSSQDIVSNKSYLDLELWMRIEGPIEYYSTMYGSLQGTGFNFSGNQGRNKWVRLSTKSIEVQHSRDGTGSIRLYGSYNLKINFAGTNMKEMSLSRTIQLPSIAQASSVPSFSFHAPFKQDTANWVDLGTGIDAKSTSFTHDVWIMDGSTTLLSLGRVKGGVRWIDITPAQSNAMLRNMSNVENKNYQLWVQTITSAGVKVGNHTLNTARAYVDESIVPVFTENLSISIAGNGKDKIFGKYMKGISKVQGKFNGTAGYGASIAKFEFVVRRVAGTDVDRTETIGNNVARPEHFQYSGQYEAWGVIRDTRGRFIYVPENNQTIKFDVYDYSAPRISSFSAVRNKNSNTQIISTVRGSFSNLSGQNRLRMKIEKRRIGVGGWLGVVDKYINWSDSFSESITSYSNLTDSSYEFRLEISDDYGNVVNATQTVSTAKVLMDFNKDIGVGIGKVHEKGALDIAGATYVNDMRLDMAPKFKSVAPSATDTPHFWTNLPQGSYKVSSGDFPGQPATWGLIQVINDEDFNDWTILFYAQGPGEQQIFRKHGNASRNNPWEPLTAQKGSNSYGSWTKLPDGTMICETTVDIRSGARTAYGAMFYLYTTPGNWTFPQAFISTPSLSYATADTNSFITNSGVNRSRISTIIAYFLVGTNSSGTTPLTITAIGRWK